MEHCLVWTQPHLHVVCFQVHHETFFYRKVLPYVTVKTIFDQYLSRTWSLRGCSWPQFVVNNCVITHIIPGCRERTNLIIV